MQTKYISFGKTFSGCYQVDLEFSAMRCDGIIKNSEISFVWRKK